MTKFKEYIRDKGFLLECDMECLPCDGVEEVVVIPEHAMLCVYHNCYGWMNTVFHQDGSWEDLWTNSDLIEASIMREEYWARRV